MITVGDKFPAFSLQGINEKNEFVRVNVEENYTPLNDFWAAFKKTKKVIIKEL